MRTFFNKYVSSQLIDLFSQPSYVSFSLSVLFSQLAYNMMLLVLIFLIYFLTSSSLSVSLLILFMLVPQIFLSFLGGVVADVKNKKTILIYGNVLRGVFLLLLFFNTKSVFLVYVVTIATSIVTQFYVPAESPLIPKLVKKEHLLAANSIFGISLFGSILISYVLAGPLIGVLGRSGIFLLLSALFFISGFLAYLMPARVEYLSIAAESIIKIKRSFRQEFRESLSILRKTGRVGGAFFLLTSSQVIILIIATLIPGFAKTILGVAAEDLSLYLFAPAALGTVVAALGISTLWRNVREDTLMDIGVLGSGLILCLFPFTPRLLSGNFIYTANPFLPNLLKINGVHVTVFLSFLAGLSNAFIFVPSQALIQDLIPENFRSKIYGLLFALIGVFSLVPIIVAGTVADIFGVGAVLVGVGIVILLLGAVRIGVRIKLSL